MIFNERNAKSLNIILFKLRSQRRFAQQRETYLIHEFNLNFTLLRYSFLLSISTPIDIWETCCNRDRSGNPFFALAPSPLERVGVRKKKIATDSPTRAAG